MELAFAGVIVAFLLIVGLAVTWIEKVRRRNTALEIENDTARQEIETLKNEKRLFIRTIAKNEEDLSVSHQLYNRKCKDYQSVLEEL